MKEISIIITDHETVDSENGKVVSTLNCTVDDNDGFLSILEYLMNKRMCDSMTLAFNIDDRNPEHIKFLRKMSTDAIVKQFHEDRVTAKRIEEAERNGVDPNVLVKYTKAGTYSEDFDIEAAFREIIESIESNM